MSRLNLFSTTLYRCSMATSRAFLTATRPRRTATLPARITARSLVRDLIQRGPPSFADLHQTDHRSPTFRPAHPRHARDPYFHTSSLAQPFAGVPHPQCAGPSREAGGWEATVCLGQPSGETGESGEDEQSPEERDTRELVDPRNGLLQCCGEGELAISDFKLHYRARLKGTRQFQRFGF